MRARPNAEVIEMDADISDREIEVDPCASSSTICDDGYVAEDIIPEERPPGSHVVVRASAISGVDRQLAWPYISREIDCVLYRLKINEMSGIAGANLKYKPRRTYRVLVGDAIVSMNSGNIRNPTTSRKSSHLKFHGVACAVETVVSRAHDPRYIIDGYKPHVDIPKPWREKLFYKLITNVLYPLSMYIRGPPAGSYLAKKYENGANNSDASAPGDLCVYDSDIDGDFDSRLFRIFS